MGSAPIAKSFGELVRRLRADAGFSQEEFADRCGLHRTYIGAIERGEKTVTIQTASKLAKALHLKLSQLFAELEKLNA
jgi:transcriptional regulator with XRE-family HTH domain